MFASSRRAAAFLTLLLALGLTPPAAAQDASRPASVRLDLTADEVDLIALALGRLPYAQVAPLFDKIRAQIAAQQAAAPRPPVPGPGTPAPPVAPRP